MDRVQKARKADEIYDVCGPVGSSDGICDRVHNWITCVDFARLEIPRPTV